MGGRLNWSRSNKELVIRRHGREPLSDIAVAGASASTKGTFHDDWTVLRDQQRKEMAKQAREKWDSLTDSERAEQLRERKSAKKRRAKELERSIKMEPLRDARLRKKRREEAAAIARKQGRKVKGRVKSHASKPQTAKPKPGQDREARKRALIAAKRVLVVRKPKKRILVGFP
ncbi:MAG TPA: hypothetical protein VM144_18665 [Aestuariivirga sp.]|nr:hypothetical protein [Aestuariivirga sp.]